MPEMMGGVPAAVRAGAGALAWFVYNRPAARAVEAAVPLPAAALFVAEAVDYC